MSKPDKKGLQGGEKSPLSIIAENTVITIVAPFNGADFPVKVRIPNSVGCQACGEFSMIPDDVKEFEGGKLDIESTVSANNLHYKLIDMCLISPTLDEITETIKGSDRGISAMRKDLDKIRELLKSDEIPESEKEKLTDEANRLEVITGFLLPDDFRGYILSFCLNIDRSDILKLSSDMILKAALKAEACNNAPIDHLNGVFTNTQKDHITNKALYLKNEWKKKQQEMNEATQGSPTKWIGGLIRGGRRGNNK